MIKTLKLLFCAAAIAATGMQSLMAQTIITVAGGTATSLGDGGQATAAQLKFPTCVAVDASGNMYIADSYNQRIRFVNSSGIISTIAGTGTSGLGADNIPATNSALYAPNGVAFDASGNVYIAEQGGSVVRKVSSTGYITTIGGTGTSGFTGDGVATAKELNQCTNLAVDPTGNVYVADWNNSRVRVITPAGNMYTVAGGGSATGYGGAATAALLHQPYSVSLDGYGNLYVSDENGQRLVKVNLASDNIYAVGGTYITPGFTGVGGPATAAEYDLPDGIVADAGSLYIADYGNNRIRQVNIATDIDSVAVGDGTPGFAGDGSIATAAELNGPAGVAIDVYGNIYIADYNNNRIRKVSSNNHPPHFVNGTPQSFNVCENSIGDSLNTLLEVNDIDVGQTETWSLRLAPTHGYVNATYTTISTGSAMTPVGLYYSPFTDYSGPDSFRVSVNDGISVDSTMIYVNVQSFFAGLVTPNPVIICPGNTVSLSSDTSGGSLSSGNTSIATVAGGVVTGIGAGNVAISYSVTNSCGTAVSTAEVRVGVPIITTFSGTGTVGYTGDGGLATNATMNNPHGISIDPSTGYIYFIDDFNSVIRKVDPSTNIITTVAGTGTTGYTGDGVATAVELNHPFEVLADGLGNLYVSDASNNMVRKINSSGIITTIAGSTTAGSSGDGGQAATAQLNTPSGLAIDAYGNLYIGDINNNKVRMINPAGIISTYAGTGVGAFLGDNNPATAAELYHCNYLHMDPLGNLIVVDNGNQRIRKIDAKTHIITTIVGTGSIGNTGDNGSALSATLNYPGGVAFDGGGNMYIASDGGEGVRMVNTQGIITTVAGTGTAGYSGDNGPPTAATLHTTVDVAFDANGNLFIADQQNNVVRKIITDAPTVSPIVGPTTLCAGTITLTDATLDGSWTSSNIGVASVGAGSGVVSGVGYGTTIITYSVTYPCGTMIATQTVTVTPPPGAITGNPGVCVGSTTQLNDGTMVGTWTSSNTSVATVGTGTGTVFGVFAGSATITYSLGAGCNAYQTVTVFAMPLAISPPTPVSMCVGNFFDLSDGSLGGTWSSSNVSVGTVTGSGVVTGVSAGTVNITYTLNGGCYVTKNVTINVTPTPLSPTSATICQNKTASYTESVSGGIWSSSNVSVGTVSTSGQATGVGAGSALISYSIGSCIVTASLTVNAAPTSITGSLSVCAGASTTLTGNPGGGTWVSGNTTVGTINGSGVVSGLLAGTTIITYTLSSGCNLSSTVIVTSSPSAISGATSVCSGYSTTLSDLPGGGTWTSSNNAVGTVSSGGGVVTGITSGTLSITYSLGTGCLASTLFTVNPNPSGISGVNNVCVGSSATLTDVSSGGNWTSSNSSVAPVAGGVVTGSSAGTAIITYTLTTGCYTTYGFTVNPNPNSISGTKSLCQGSSVTLSDIPGGGNWTSTNLSVATVGLSSGIVNGVGAGTVVISYALGSCIAQTTVTVNPNPASITGNFTLCSGGSTTLNDLTSGGNWTSSNTGVATINSSSGFMSAVGVGSSIISYTLGTGCSQSVIVTVNSGPSGITGLGNVCVGSSTTLFDGVSGGTWISSNSFVATVGSGSGDVTGVSAGTALITYNLGLGCQATTLVTVNALPFSITPSGSVSICPGNTFVLADISSGTFSSSNTGVATVGASSGVVTGISAGTATISYTNAAGCSALKTVTVNPAPDPISPSSPVVCVGGTTGLTDFIGGGTWISNNIGLATVGSSSGTVTGVVTGTVIITYTIGTCYVTVPVTVSGVLAAGTITGATTMCVGTPITLSDAAPGGTWVSGNTGVATVGSTSGIVNGVTSGTVIISYVVSNTCGSAAATTTISVSVPGAGAISGPASVCAGTFGNYTDPVPAGTWSLANTAATITVGGVVTGVTPGTDIITYTVSNACGISATTKSISIGAFLTAGAIFGSNTVCTGSNTVLTDLAPGGTWSASNTTASVVGGTVTGVTVGVDTISYTVTSACGSAYAIHNVTVNPVPVVAAISGPSSICIGSSTTYTDPTSGGVWSVRNATATISVSGLVTPVSTGTNIISYSVSNSCGTATATETVNIGAFLTAGTILGPTSVCVGSSITLTDATGGGVWTASNGDATVSGGVVTGVSAGTDIISYMVTASCGSVSATTTITVNPIPVAGTITGPSSICTGLTTTYTDPATGGVWSVRNATATITVGGVVSPVSAGTNIISYVVSNTCGTAFTTETINIGVGPNAGAITGPSSVCTGTPIVLSESVSGGTWSSSNGDATVVGGTVSGVSAGVAVISYTVSNSCGTASATQSVTVNLSPNAGTIIGPSALCVGSFVTYIDAATGGTWSISNSSATITSGGGVNPVSTGLDTISYTVSNVCGTAVATKTVAISTSVTAGAISGLPGVCIGSSITLTDGVTGGTWSSSNASVATINSSGVVSGVTVGTTLISYTVTNSCGTAVATTVVTSGFAPNAGSISGASSVCASSSTSYTDAAPGGSWGVTNTNASITGGGLLTGLVPFSMDTITYTVTNGCGTAIATKTVSIGALFTVGNIFGPAGVCMGSTINMTDPTMGGTWSSNPIAVATIGAGSGVVTGVAPGTAIISYSVALGCGTVVALDTIAVSTAPIGGTITGASSVCAGSSITLTDLIPGGTWGTTNANASISSGGVVTGLTPGLDTIVYTLTNFCGSASATKTVAINSFPVAGVISGLSTICPGGSTTLTDGVTGGIWTSENAHATVGAGTGVVTGVTAGTTNISYTVTNACGSAYTLMPVTVSSLPDPGTIAGPDSVCVGASISLSDAMPGGIWNAGSGNASVYLGTVIGVTSGTDIISYTITNSCGASSAILTIVIDSTPDPGVISGSTGVCLGSGILLTETVSGGTWIASNSNASVVGPGIIDGVSLGIDTIFYDVSNSCGSAAASKILSVNPVPVVPAMGGPTTQCPGTSITMTDGVTGGLWVSSNPAVAYVGASTGIVTGVITGTTTISYTITNSFGCPATATTNDTVVTAPSLPGITGSPNVCVGSTIILSDSVSGGSWYSSNPTLANIDISVGVVTGFNAGTVTISYSVATVCGTSMVTRTETINLLPVVSAITGVMHECSGAETTLMDATTGGTWSSTNPSVATIGSSSGTVTGVLAGTVTMVYTYTNIYGCSASVSATNTVLASPAVSAITGVTNECIGATTTLSDPTLLGIWTSSNPSVATIGSGSGVVTGVTGGITNIMYTVTNLIGCTSSATAWDTVNVRPVESAITGTMNICAGASTTLADAVPFGTWSSGHTSIAMIDPATGTVTGVAAGTDKIYYSVINSCGSALDSAVFTVNAIPSAGTISAAYTTLCSGTTVHLSDPATGGVWSSNNIAVATVSSTGVVTGVSAGSVIISYVVTSTSGCVNSTAITLNIAAAMASASVTPAGAVTLCHGNSEYMHVVTSGAGLTYQWLRNGAAIAGANTSGYITTTAGAYSVEISNGTCSETVAGPTVEPPPTPVITYMPTDELTTGTFSRYQWYLNGIVIPGAVYSTYTYTAGGMYTVVVTDADGCSDTSLAYAVAAVNAVQTVSGPGNIKVYPNPASTWVNIDAPENVGIKLYSIDGQVIMEEKDVTHIDIGRLAAGIYMLEIYNEDGLLLKTVKVAKIE